MLSWVVEALLIAVVVVLALCKSLLFCKLMLTLFELWDLEEGRRC